MNNFKKIKIEDIVPFKNHPYKINIDESLIELSESIKENGLLNPIIVRPKDGKYEMISGHRRLKALELNDVTEVDAYVKELTDDEATILMVDSNLQREKVLPSEKAFAYKMKLDALKHQGKQSSTCGQDGHKSRDIISKTAVDSSRNIQRYIRLTYLIPELLKLVDDSHFLTYPH